MATSRSNLIAMKGGDTKPKPKAAVNTNPVTDAQLRAFGNFGGTTDVKSKAAYLAKKGMIGASQLLTDHPDLSSKNGIINSQSDWKTSAMEAMLMQARKLGLKSPTQIAANKPALMATLRPELAAALNHPTFNQIHPNWWDTFNGVLKDQYTNEALTPTPTAVAVK